jgi:murein DD-endopeptidase MepM/ murein hydrolase activator NlpD
MRFYKTTVYFLFFFSITNYGYGQVNTEKDKKKKFVDFLNIKVPAINYAVPDTAVLYDERGKLNLNKKSSYSFDPTRRDFNVLESPKKDTLKVDPKDFSIVEIDEEMKVNENDSTWIKIAEYYAIWDNKAVNPYGIDVTKFSDTVKLILYDSTIGRNWCSPLRETFLNDDFGPRRYRWHYGVDLELDTGDSVFAVWDGIVRISKYDGGGYGNYVLIRHFNGTETVYGHLSKQLVQVGELVKAGDLIGWGGSTGRSTGPHLHFELRYQGYAIDPELFFEFRENHLMWREFNLMPSHFGYLKRVRKVYFHRVRRGDTLSEIADKYNVTIRQILRLNKISMRTTLKQGRRLRIR